MERNKPRHRPSARPGRDIAAAVAAKIVALALLYALFFSSTQRVAVDAASMEARLADVPAPDQVKR